MKPLWLLATVGILCLFIGGIAYAGWYYGAAAGGAVSISVGATKTSSTDGSLTFEHTVDANTTMLIAAVSWEDTSEAGGVASMVWNTSENLTEGATENTQDKYHCSIWYLVNPTATTANVVITLDNACAEGPVSFAINLLGTDTADPIRDSGNDYDYTENGTPEVSLTGIQATDMVVGVAAEYEATAGAWTWEATATEQISGDYNDCNGSIGTKLNDSAFGGTGDWPSIAVIAVKD